MKKKCSKALLIVVEGDIPDSYIFAYSREFPVGRIS